MKNCPNCYSELTSRNVTPCFICGGWHLDSKNHEYAEYALDDDRKITLCTICYLEEFLSDQGNNKEFINARNDELRFQKDIIDNHKEHDKYCEACNKRLALLKLKKQV